ncbi:AGAP000296-PA [Anopheles gambiae str. PEST]|uniref:AGAP000296-PA n=1 Tax=Anopheles gambiae TaxID=7165 RepID=A7USI4_ANOGA|nr:AGAP000296-PA [Anopheles gambiae str. PEST]
MGGQGPSEGAAGRAHGGRAGHRHSGTAGLPVHAGAHGHPEPAARGTVAPDDRCAGPDPAAVQRRRTVDDPVRPLPHVRDFARAAVGPALLGHDRAQPAAPARLAPAGAVVHGACHRRAVRARVRRPVRAQGLRRLVRVQLGVERADAADRAGVRGRNLAPAARPVRRPHGHRTVGRSKPLCPYSPFVWGFFCAAQCVCDLAACIKACIASLVPKLPPSGGKHGVLYPFLQG